MGRVWTGRQSAQNDIWRGTCDSFTAYKVQKRRSLSGRANVLMGARDRCCHGEHPVWKRTLFGLMSPEEEGRRRSRDLIDGKKKKRGNIPNQAVFKEIAWKTLTYTVSKGLCIWKTNLKSNLGNQLSGPREPEGERKKKRRERSTLLPPSLPMCLFLLHLTGTWICPLQRCVMWGGFVSVGFFSFFFFLTRVPYMLSKCLKSLIKEMPQLISL